MPRLLVLSIIVAINCLFHFDYLMAERPNVLFIISDDLSASALGCYGNKQCRTPNIDRLASQSMLFNRAYCQYPVCGPSRAALMSGMYCQEIGVMSNGQSEHFTEQMGGKSTMSQHFIQNGYEATRVSKIYHMRVPGDITAGVDGPDHKDSWSQTFNCQSKEQWTKGEHEMLSKEKLKPDPKQNIHYKLGYGSAFYVVKAADDAARQADALAADKAIELLETHQKIKESGIQTKPFFMAVGLVRPHVPLVAPASYFDMYPFERVNVPEILKGDLDDIPMIGRDGNRGLTSEVKRQKALAAYYATVTYMDTQVGRMLKALARLKLTQNTIIVFCSDHGWHLGEHGFWQKMSLHEESARIAMMISSPGMKPGITDALVEQIDLYPTLTELAGLKRPQHLSGKSLVTVLKDASASVRNAAYCARTKKGINHLLRTDRWAYIEYSKKHQELYDMDKDPKQYTNLIKHPEYAGTLKKLKKMLAEKLASMKK